MGRKKTKENSSNYAQIEDVAMKYAAQYFQEELLSYLGIEEKIRRIAPTEQVHLEVRKLYEDFNYELESKRPVWLHLEFESDSIKKEDLRRFREYEASTSRTYNVEVITCVICSSKVKNLTDSFTAGINTYKIKVVRLKDDNADVLFEKLKTKKKIAREDIIPILFTPLMDGKMPQVERIRQGIELTYKAEEVLTKEEQCKMQAVLYAFAHKFLKTAELDKIKEMMTMMPIGQMIYDDGARDGEILKLISQVVRKWKKGQSAKKISEDLLEDEETIYSIYEVARENPDYDKKQIYKELQKKGAFLE